MSGTFPEDAVDNVVEQVAAAEGQEVVEKPGSRFWKNMLVALREVIEIIVLALVIFFLIQLVVRNFRVVGSSMEPNLHDGQHLIVNKLLYNFYPPERGDVVVFHFPQDPSRDYIKRVIGLPGETVEIRKGQVYINGRLLEEHYQVNPGSYTSQAVAVAENELFVLGDNRNNSSDSHTWGMLPQNQIVGKAWISYWPLGNLGVVPHQTFGMK